MSGTKVVPGWGAYPSAEFTKIRIAIPVAQEVNGTDKPSFSHRMKRALRFSFGASLLLLMMQGASGQQPPTMTWTGTDPSGYWSAPGNWSPPGVPVSGNALVFPGGLPSADMVSTNDLTDGIFRSVTFDQAGGHTIRGNPITLTNGTTYGYGISNSGTNVVGCDLTFAAPISGWYPRIWGSGELTVTGNVGGGPFHVGGTRLVIRGQLTGGSLRAVRGTVAFYGDNPQAAFSAEAQGGNSLLLVRGSQPNVNIRLFYELEDLSIPTLSGDGLVGDVTGTGYIALDSTLSVKNLSLNGYLHIHLNGTNVGEYGRLVVSNDVSLSSSSRGRLFPSLGFNPQASQVFTIVEKASPGPITNAIFGPEGTVTNLNGMALRISYVGGDGNDVTLTAQPSNANPTFSDANWSPLGSGLGPGGVAALAVSGTDLYVGGGFTTAGGSPANCIAKWDMTHWSALGSGFFYPFDFKARAAVFALAVSGGDLYAGGRFTKAGDNPATNIAKWNGSTWNALGSGMSGGAYPVVTALAVSGSHLYAGGLFRSAGGSPATNIAKWNGTSWSALGSGMNGLVYALAASGSNLYAGGQFTMAGGTPVNNIARWDGSNWNGLGSGVVGVIFALAVSGTNLYAGGTIVAAGGSPANRIAKWDGSSWSALGTGVVNQFGQGDVRALAVSGDDLYAGGEFTTADGSPADNIAKWDGTTWNPLGSGMNNRVYALALSGSSLYAGGWFTTAGGTPANYIAKARIASAAESITASGSSATLQFSAVVGYEYHVQRTESLTPPITWTTLTASPLSPAADGSLSFTDTNVPAGTAYYRLVQH